jgi:cyclic lactone autoinducer peptide
MIKRALREEKIRLICSLAIACSVIAANTRCMCIYHELKKPDELRLFEKK